MRHLSIIHVHKTSLLLLTANAVGDSILVTWHPPKDQSIKVRKYKLGWGKGYPDVEIQVLDGKQRSFAMKPIGNKAYSTFDMKREIEERLDFILCLFSVVIQNRQRNT